MTSDAELLAGLRVERITAEFVWLVDSGRADSVASLLADDVRFHVGGATLDRDEVLRRFNERANASYSTRHAISNVRVLEQAPGRIFSAFLVTITRVDPSAGGERSVQLSEWRLEAVARPDGWLIREVTFEPFDAGK